LHAITPAQGEKQMARPLIRHQEPHLNRRILPAKFSQTLPHAFQCCFRREALAGRSGTREKSLDLPQLLAQLRPIFNTLR
ncbi:MAG TPA: hypothetical protein VLN57_13340, partial [Xanthobacteraceae bacterium]|nr:hypothetical protein [Xanthobacteraceae bacterium]